MPIAQRSEFIWFLPYTFLIDGYKLVTLPEYVGILVPAALTLMKDFHIIYMAWNYIYLKSHGNIPKLNASGLPFLTA